MRLAGRGNRRRRRSPRRGRCRRGSAEGAAAAARLRPRCGSGAGAALRPPVPLLPLRQAGSCCPLVARSREAAAAAKPLLPPRISSCFPSPRRCPPGAARRKSLSQSLSLVAGLGNPGRDYHIPATTWGWVGSMRWQGARPPTAQLETSGAIRRRSRPLDLPGGALAGSSSRRVHERQRRRRAPRPVLQVGAAAIVADYATSRSIRFEIGDGHGQRGRPQRRRQPLSTWARLRAHRLGIGPKQPRK